MTAAQDPTQPDPSEAMAAATADLAGLQDVVRRAAQGRAGVAEVSAAVSRFRDDHGPALQAAAAALGENVRGQMLGELYRMREQLARQREGRGGREGEEAAPGPSAGSAADRDGAG